MDPVTVILETPTTWSYLMDMDGVLVHEEHIIPGADKFIAELTARDANFIVVTNNPIYTRRDLRARLRRTGLDIPEERIWTSALATAQFLHNQRPGGTAFVIGEVGLTTAMHEAGYVLTDRNPDYVVLGETRNYSFEQITTAIRLIGAGSRFVATNPDPTGPSRAGRAAGRGRGGGADREGDRSHALLRRQAEPVDDAVRDAGDRRPLGEHPDDRRPDGHRRDRRAGVRDADRAGDDRDLHAWRRWRSTRSGRPWSSTPSPTWSGTPRTRSR